jgi:hypothetical protein
MDDSYQLFEFANGSEKLSHHHYRLERLCQQIIECARFLSSYGRDKSFSECGGSEYSHLMPMSLVSVKRAGRQVFSGADAAIDQYLVKFEEIKNSYRTQSIARIELTTIAILSGVENIRTHPSLALTVSSLNHYVFRITN